MNGERAADYDATCWLNEDCVAGYHGPEQTCRFPSWVPDALTAAIQRVERHKVVNAQTGETTGYMLPADEWRQIRAALRRPIQPGAQS